MEVKCDWVFVGMTFVVYIFVFATFNRIITMVVVEVVKVHELYKSHKRIQYIA